MAENITSLLEKKALAAANALPTDVIYVVHGTGTPRDKKMTFEELIAYFVSNEKFTELKIVQDASHDITIKWDSDNNEFVIWERANSGTVAVPKLHVHGTLLVEKDTTVNADLGVDKALHVTLGSTFGGMAEFSDYIISKKGLDAKGKSVFERINAGSSKSYFEADAHTDIDTLLSGTTIEVSKGDVVVVRNTSGGSDIKVSVGTYDSTLNYVTTLKAYCSMAFIRTGVTTGNGVKWSPLCNSEVTTDVFT